MVGDLDKNRPRNDLFLPPSCHWNNQDNDKSRLCADHNNDPIPQHILDRMELNKLVDADDSNQMLGLF